jgi:hypothetical protein
MGGNDPRFWSHIFTALAVRAIVPVLLFGAVALVWWLR